MAKAGLQKLKRQKAVIEARIQKLTAAERAKKLKRDKQAQFLVGAFSLEEARKDGTLEKLKTKVAQSLKREADKQAVIMFGVGLTPVFRTRNYEHNMSLLERRPNYASQEKEKSQERQGLLVRI